MHENIYLIGFMGAGKSTVARALSKKTGEAVIEMDDEIAFRAGMSIPEIFEKKGEAAFRSMESALLRETAAGGPAIVSCGGGLIKSEENIACMKASGCVIYLRAQAETVLKRTVNDTSRPLLAGKKDISSIAAMIAERTPLYEKAGEIVVDVDGQTPDAIAERILVDLKNRNC